MMRKLRITLALVLLNAMAFGQKSDKQAQAGQDMAYRALYSAARAASFKNGPGYYLARPDSVIEYSDTLKNKALIGSFFSYDGNKITVSSKKYDQKKGKWDNTTKKEYFFGAGLPDLPYEYYFDTYQYTIDGTVYNYGKSIGDTLSIRYGWDTASNGWSPIFKTSHSFDNGLCARSTTYRWDTAQKEFVHNCIILQELTSLGPDSLAITLKATENSAPFAKELFAFDHNGLGQIVKAQDCAFIIYGEYIIDSMAYDGRDNVIEEYNLLYDDYYYLKNTYKYDPFDRRTRDHVYYKDSASAPWTYFCSYAYYYSWQPVTGIGAPAETNGAVFIYPNPANGQFYVHGYNGRASLANIAGQVAMEVEIIENCPISINGLKKGFYILTLENGTSKVLIKE